MGVEELVCELSAHLSTNMATVTTRRRHHLSSKNSVCLASTISFVEVYTHPVANVIVMAKQCVHGGCSTLASYGEKGSDKYDYCWRHAAEGMVDVRNKKCAHEGCVKRATFGAEGGKERLFCAQHALDGMVSMKGKRCIMRAAMSGPCSALRELERLSSALSTPEMVWLTSFAGGAPMRAAPRGRCTVCQAVVRSNFALNMPLRAWFASA